MQPIVKKIKDRVNIVDIIGSFIKVERSGINHKACCPFHHEKTPSFFVSEQRQTFNCFGCGLKGDVVEFVKLYEHLDFKDALRYVFDRSGLPESDWQQNQERSSQDIKADQEKKLLRLCLKMLLIFTTKTYLKKKAKRLWIIFWHVV